MGLGDSGAGLGELREAIAQAVRPNQVRRPCISTCSRRRCAPICIGANAVRAERQCDDGSWELDVELDPAEMAKVLGSRGVMPVAPPEKAARSA